MKPQPELITMALESLQRDKESHEKAIFTTEGAIPRKFNGYVASFGGSIVQLGIMPACMALMADDNKKKLGAMMFGIYAAKYDLAASGQSLDEYLKSKWTNWPTSERNAFRNRITMIAVSMKLAMRTYKFDESESMD